MKAKRFRTCRNRRCQELIGAFVRVPVCPSCRVAGRAGAAVAFGIVVVARVGWALLEWLS